MSSTAFVWKSLWNAMQDGGFSADSLADKIGKKRRTVYAYLRGEVTPPLAEIVAIASALNVPESQLRDGTPLPQIFSP